MTVVEFFDGVSICNMVSCLTIKPDKIIFIGDRKPMAKQEAAYSRFAANQGLDVTFGYEPINRNNLEQIISVLTDIAEREEDCVFDLTGGEDLVLVAMGVVYERFKDTGKLQMHRFNIRSGIIQDCDNDGIIPITEEPDLPVTDNIMLYGGIVVPYDGEKGTYDWVFDSEFIADIEEMWDICKANPGLWNSQISTLAAMAEVGKATADGLTVSANMAQVENAMKSKKKNKSKFNWVSGYVNNLCRRGLITQLIEDGDRIQLTFKNEQVKMCLTKAGTLLELVVMRCAEKAVEKDGNKTYSYAMNGVYIDWDASLHDEDENEKDTENEIDVILMKGMVPVFVSCKNGGVDSDELYKLNTVAGRFGGPYAKKVLVTTYVGGSKDKSHQYLVQRANDMNIDLIENVHQLSEEKLTKRLKNLRF